MPDSGHQSLGERREADDRQRQGDVRDAGLERGVVQHLLHVEGEQEELREHRCAHQQRRSRSRRSACAAGICASAAAAPSTGPRSAGTRGSAPRTRPAGRSSRLCPSRAGSRGSSRRRAASARLVIDAAPAKSKCRCARSARLSRSSHGLTASTRTPAGTLMKKIHDQLKRAGQRAAEQHSGRAAASRCGAPDARARRCARGPRGTSWSESTVPPGRAAPRRVPAAIGMRSASPPTTTARRAAN